MPLVANFLLTRCTSPHTQHCFCQLTRYHQTSGSGLNPLDALNHSTCTGSYPLDHVNHLGHTLPNVPPSLNSMPSSSSGSNPLELLGHSTRILLTAPLPQQDIIILQNKIDLVNENAAIQQHESIHRFIEGTIADGAPVVPISAQLMYNVDVVCEYIVKKIPVPVR